LPTAATARGGTLSLSTGAGPLASSLSGTGTVGSLSPAELAAIYLLLLDD
jgi:hypothetical protein